MKKITILALHLGYGGVEKSIASLSNILVERYSVEIITVYKLYDKPAFNIDDRVKITYLLEPEMSPNKKEFKEAIESKNIYKIIKEGLKSVKILKLKKIKMKEAVRNIKEGIVISTRVEHNAILSKFGDDNLIKIAQEHTHHNNNEKYIKSLVESCENIDYFMPVSKELTKFYSKYFKNTKTKCVYIPHSLDYIPYLYSRLESKNIVSVGRLSKEKGFEDLIDVFYEVIKKRKDWILNIIGDGQEKENIHKKIKDYGIENNIILHGYQDKSYVDNVLFNSSIYVMGSYEESFGIVLIEAQSFGVPCIAFNSAKGACEIISDNVDGYLISNRDKKEMSNKIIDLIDNRELRLEMGKKSRQNALKYSKENISKEWFNLLERL
ncbi:MAG: glycosyltransferase [Paeniclostridium sordellii]|nr:glycosyltransferase [Paeniclostridium sordellii]